MTRLDVDAGHQAVKKEVVEEECERHAQLQSVVKDIALALNARSALRSSAQEVCRAGTPTAARLLVGLVW